MKETKEQLQKKLNAIAKQEAKDMIAEYYPIFKEQYEGRYFKYKNSYSLPKKSSDYWWLYIKVVEVKPSDIYKTLDGVSGHFSGWSFQTDQYGNISIEKKRFSYLHSLGQEITEKEFNEAWNKMAESLDKLP